jgi:hypothetical protein
LPRQLADESQTRKIPGEGVWSLDPNTRI